MAILGSRKIIGISAVFLFPALMQSAWAAEWKGSCDILFQGTSTLHDFSGNVRCQPFRIGVGDPGKGKRIIRSAAVSVLADEMDTGNKSRDRKMREMFQSDKFPRIEGVFGGIDPESIRQELRRSPEGKAPLSFTLKIRDIERPVHAVAGNFRESGEGVSFDVEYSLSLKDYRLVPPSPFFGIVRVDDKVSVKTSIRLETGGTK